MASSDFLVDLQPYQSGKRLRFFIFLLFSLSVFFLFFVVPFSFVRGTYVQIPAGTSVGQAAVILKTNHIIRSSYAFDLFFKLFHHDQAIIAGEYYFSNPLVMPVVINHLTLGILGIPQVKVTLPEGLDHFQMASVLGSKIPNFSEPDFLSLTQDKEGYLFPDTYFFDQNITPIDVVQRLQAEFNSKTEPLADDIKNSGHSLSDIIIMASIIEREGSTDTDRSIIAGILWKRLANGMRLQVDAPFEYILHKPLNELTPADLTTNSPYNTYLYSGLPPTPICNPGLASILAAIHPTNSPYFFYLYDKYGTIHFAKTFAEHKENIKKYLD